MGEKIALPVLHHDLKVMRTIRHDTPFVFDAKFVELRVIVPVPGEQAVVGTDKYPHAGLVAHCVGILFEDSPRRLCVRIFSIARKNIVEYRPAAISKSLRCVQRTSEY